MKQLASSRTSSERKLESFWRDISTCTAYLLDCSSEKIIIFLIIHKTQRSTRSHALSSEFETMFRTCWCTKTLDLELDSDNSDITGTSSSERTSFGAMLDIHSCSHLDQKRRGQSSHLTTFWSELASWTTMDKYIDKLSSGHNFERIDGTVSIKCCMQM